MLPTPVERAGNLGLPGRAPFLGKKWGKRPPGEEVPPRDPLLWWGCLGEALLLTGLPRPRPSQRKARNGPPTGWAGWGRGRYPLEEGREKLFGIPAVPPVKSIHPPARPSWWAGHEALVLEAAGQVRRVEKKIAPSTTVQRKGVWGKETLSPAGSRGRTVRGTVRSILREAP